MWLIEASYLIHILCQGQIVVCKEVRLSAEADGCIALSRAAQMQHATLVGKNREGTIAITSNHCLECTPLQEKVPVNIMTMKQYAGIVLNNALKHPYVCTDKKFVLIGKAL